MLSAGAKELVEAALRILNRWTLGQKPALLDVQLLQQHAPPMCGRASGRQANRLLIV